ncbi:hypothetical protein OGAPHI_004457 [Ogataea philodendri]|uniref:aminodeoxychorismate synthase n=1 Tax=Ogataea philodendri TaxID=1378263 RepID=A0A9P8P679_9ASCO|nr:uncharacterized protein OGAPHI_004457 [Ogataea philodendri]KAH3666268.1 hypothetical protein OGAPHI_004457 [Ogataea philodendri]
MSILLVDSYDSFTYNLRELIERATGCAVFTVHNDSYQLPAEQDNLDRLISSVDAIVVGPGPGNPEQSHDVGIIPHLYSKYTEIPILGICLGFQSLCLVNGCKIRLLHEPVHGQVSKISLQGESSLFAGIESGFDSVRYHSIYVSEITDNIVPLAYSEDGCLMAAQHVTYPHFGVQYHPESICSNMGAEMLSNFGELVQKTGQKRVADKHLLNVQPLILQFSSSKEFDFQFEKVSRKETLSVCEIGDDFLLLNSASVPGKWTIIGFPEPNTSQLITHSQSSGLSVGVWKGASEAVNQDLWPYVSRFMAERKFQPRIDDPELKDCPFMGGFIGFISYEESAPQDVEPITSSPIPDTKLCFTERFVATNENHTFVVSIRPNDDLWIADTTAKLNTLNPSVSASNIPAKIEMPDKQQYVESFNKCQEYLHSGDSYELCLTTQCKIHIDNTISPWEVYKSLVSNNPSPYSCYLDFGDAKLLSSSPERFLSWDDEHCQMRPIKGTVKKDSTMTYEKACKLLKIPKELGENLMIVDLIRHDLYQMLNKVEVTKLMSVEEYHTVYQLVSVIEGDLHGSNYSGIDLLKHSLPPGSMTGAPKKRSVELLHELEHQKPRGLYSGVCGFWSVNNRADWSVVIRSLFNYEDDLCSTASSRCFRCGAGGAITVLSTCEGEWDELVLKLNSVLKVFK